MFNENKSKRKLYIALSHHLQCTDSLAGVPLQLNQSTIDYLRMEWTSFQLIMDAKAPPPVMAGNNLDNP